MQSTRHGGAGTATDKPKPADFRYASGNAFGIRPSNAPSNAFGIAAEQCTYGRTDGLTKNLSHPADKFSRLRTHARGGLKSDRKVEAMSAKPDDRLTPAPSGNELSTGSTTVRHPDLAKFDRALAEHDARQLADEIGYAFFVLTDGTIILEPPVDAEYQRRVTAAIDRLFGE